MGILIKNGEIVTASERFIGDVYVHGQACGVGLTCSALICE